MDERARVATRVAQILAKVANPFEFDLLARKAATMIGVGEELLRSEARKSGAGRRDFVARPAMVSAPVKPHVGPQGAAAQAELGLVVIALRWPEFRHQIAAQLGPDDGDGLRTLIKEICASEQAPASLEIAVMDRLAEHERAQLSALMVGPLFSDAAQSVALIEDYLNALDAHQRRGQMAELRRTAGTGTVEEGAAAAQEVITLRQEARRH